MGKRNQPLLWKRVAVAAVLLLLFVAAYLLKLSQYLTLDVLREKLAVMKAFQGKHPLGVEGLFFLIYVAVTAVSFPGAVVLTLLGGALFGFWQGLVIVSFASTIGATLAFLLARFLLRDWIQLKYQSQLVAINAGFAREGAFYLFALRLIPLLPFFLVNLLTSVMPIKTHRFMIASQLGMLPGTAVYVYAGTELGQLRSVSDIFSPALLAVFVLLGLFPLLAKKTVGFIRARIVM